MGQSTTAETAVKIPMVEGLVDSAIMIDILRGYPPAQTWLNRQQRLEVTHTVWLELAEGAQNKVAQAQALRLLRRFELIEMKSEDLQWAVEKLLVFRLSHNVDAFDCLMASVAARLNIAVYTRNIKHFKPLLGELAIQPY